ncbi:MAG: hypothetical protein AB7K09_07815 [Planctomycetota bacterium]
MSATNAPAGMLIVVAAVAGLAAGVAGSIIMAPAPRMAPPGTSSTAVDTTALVAAIQRLDDTVNRIGVGNAPATADHSAAAPGPATPDAKMAALLDRLDRLTAALQSAPRTSGGGSSSPPSPAPAPADPSAADARVIGASGTTLTSPDRALTLSTTFNNVLLERAWNALSSPDTTAGDAENIINELSGRIWNTQDAQAWLILRMAMRHPDPAIAAQAIGVVGGLAPPRDEVAELLRSPHKEILSATYAMIDANETPSLAMLLAQHTPPAELRQEYGDAIHSLLMDSDNWPDNVVAQLRLQSERYPPSQPQDGEGDH